MREDLPRKKESGELAGDRDIENVKDAGTMLLASQKCVSKLPFGLQVRNM